MSQPLTPLDSSAAWDMSTGDCFIMRGIVVHRRWWQIWRPRVWREDKLFRIAGKMIGGDPMADSAAPIVQMKWGRSEEAQHRRPFLRPGE